jgi:hypothetical protein
VELRQQRKRQAFYGCKARAEIACSVPKTTVMKRIIVVIEMDR